MKRIFVFILVSLTIAGLPLSVQASDDKEKTENQSKGEGHDHGGVEPEMPYAERVVEHISDANEFHLFGHYSIPLPCILYSKDGGLEVFMSSKFEHGHKAVNGYVMHHGDVRRVKGYQEGMEIEHVDHTENIETEDGKSKTVVHADGQTYELERPSTLLNFTSWVDFSITKNVFTMILVAILMWVVFRAVARGYQQREGEAPKGIQSFFEPFITFMRDEVVEPVIGPTYERYLPFILCLFFFILFLNIFGLIPFFPFSANVTGNLGTTLALALFTALVVNFSGNKDYWAHIFWMPGVPVFLRPLLAIIEFAGVFIKPFTLFIRLFANITAGHVIILSLVGMVFILGNNGQNMAGAIGGGIAATLFVFVMNLLELLVAFIQAFIFALLSSLYIGMAVEEHDHH